MLSAALLFANAPLSYVFARQASPVSQVAGGTAPSAVGPYGREDWNTLSLAGSEMHADPPLRGVNDQEATFTRELFMAQWRDGDPIDLYVIRPAHVEKPPVVLYLYSYPSETTRFMDNAYCQRVTRDGFAAVGFVSALTGHRYHTRPMKEWFVSELQESLVKSVHDVQMILNYLATRGDLDMTRLGMFGAGSGGTIAVLSAAVDPRIGTIDLLDPWGDWPDWMAKSTLVPDVERPSYVKPEFLTKAAPFDPLQWLPQLKTQKVRLQQVMDDTVTPDAARKKIQSAAPASVQIVRYDDTGALFKAVSGGALFNWIKQQLRASPSGTSLARHREPGTGSQAIERN